MDIKIIGCGGAFSEDGYLFHQSFLISEGGENLLFDMGKDVWPWAMKKQGLGVNDIHQVLITHRHDDHIGSLGTFGLKRYNWFEKPIHWKDSKKDYAPTLIYSADLQDGLWESLRGNLETNEGFVGSLETFFKLKPIKENEHWDFHGWDLQLVRQVHVMAGNSLMSTHGLFLEKGEHKIFLTGDCQFFQPKQVIWFYNRATFIITDCETVGSNFLFQEGTEVYDVTVDGKKVTKPWPTLLDDPDGMQVMELMAQGFTSYKWDVLKFSSGVHSTYPELAGYPSANATRLAPEVKGKMRLSHYGDSVPQNKDAFGNDLDWEAQAKKDGFAGFVKPGQVFHFE